MKRLFLCLLCACALHGTVTAHVLDQYLQVAQIGLATGGVHVEVRLAPGVQVADRILALIDLDHDGQISPSEEQAYARSVLHDVALELDGKRQALALTGVQFASREQMKEGLGAIRLDLSAEVPLDVSGEHQISFRNDHLPELGAYMANALVPTTDAIEITGLQRDELQQGFRVSFRVKAAHWPPANLWTGVLLAGMSLVLLVPRWRRLRRASA